MSLYNRVKGVAKAGIGALYWSIAISSGGSLPAITALYGLAILGTGRITRSIGQISGSENLKKLGAGIGDIGVKVALSPVYFTTLGLDGLSNAYNGKEDNNFSNYINKKTNWISGTKEKITSLPTPPIQKQDKNAELDAREKRLEDRANKLDERSSHLDRRAAELDAREEKINLFREGLSQGQTNNTLLPPRRSTQQGHKSGMRASQH